MRWVCGDEYMPDNRGLLAMHANAGDHLRLGSNLQDQFRKCVRPVSFRAFVRRGLTSGEWRTSGCLSTAG